nr:MLCK smooth muscle protein [Parasacculina yatsui]
MSVCDDMSVCIIFEHVPCVVVWYKDGKAMREHSGRVVISSAKNKHTLTINCCQTSDIGQYSAKAIGKKTEISANFSLNVNTKMN